MSTTPSKAVLTQGKTVLFICDLQDNFAKVIYEFDKIVINSNKLIQACQVLNVPMIVTLQNPQSFGPTALQLNIEGARGVFCKQQFSMFTPEVKQELSTIFGNGPLQSIIIIGIESHICVENTAIDLRENGFEVHIVADCCSSRTQEDRILALERMKQIGCFIATSENVIFKLLASSEHKDFKNIQHIVRTPSLHTGLVPLQNI